MDPNHVPVSAAARGAAKIFVGVTVPLYAIALAALITRILFKLRSGLRLGLDDGFIIIGFVCHFTVITGYLKLTDISCLLPSIGLC
jgi:hypothetical protein